MEWICRNLWAPAEFKTKINGEWYDLTKFHHPGGPVALACCANRDATALFESHHPVSNRSKILSVLQKYKIDDKKQEEELETTMEEPEEVTDSAHTKKESGDLFKEDEIIEYDWDPYKGKGEGSELAKELRAMV